MRPPAAPAANETTRAPARTTRLSAWTEAEVSFSSSLASSAGTRMTALQSGQRRRLPTHSGLLVSVVEQDGHLIWVIGSTLREAAVSKPAQARTAHLPPVQR